MAYETETSEFWAAATRVGAAGNSKTSSDEIALYVKTVGDARKQSMMDYLKSITTLTDATYDSKKATLAGLWRAAGASWSSSPQGYVLVMRKGWASTVLTGVAPNDECMIQGGSDSRSDARSYSFYWRNIASGAVNACVDALRVVGSFVNPTIQGEEKTGAFAIADIQAQQQDDGSYWIVVNCIKAESIADIADLAALDPLRKDTHDIENAFGLEGGHAAHIGRKPTDGIVLTYRALTVASRPVIMALTDAEFHGLLSVAEQAKYEFVNYQLAEDSGNVLTLAIAYKYVPLALTTPEASARLVGEVLFNQSGKLELTRSWPRIDPSVADTILLTNANTKVTADLVTDPLADGKTYSGSWLVLTTKPEMTAADGLRIVQVLIKAGDQKLYTKAGTDPLHLTCEFKLWDASVEAIEAFLASADPFEDASIDPKWSTPEVGITKFWKSDSNADRSINFYAVYATTASLSRTELFTAGTGAPGKLTVQDSYSASTERGFGWNIPVASIKTFSDYYAPAVKVVNTKNEFKISRRDEHTFDFEGVLQTFIPIDSGDLIAEDSAEKTVTKRTGEYILAATLVAGQAFGPAAAQVDGTVVEIDKKPNDVGSYSVVKTTTVYHAQSSTSTENKGGVEIIVKTDKKADAAQSVTTPAVNLISAVENKERPDGLTDSGKQDTTKVPTTLVNGVVVEKTAFETKTLTQLLNQTTVAPATNALEAVQVEHNGAGGVDVKRVQGAEVDAVTQDVISTPLETVTIDRHTASTAATVAGGDVAVNKGAKVSNKKTPGGNYESEKTGTVKTPWQYPDTGTPANDYVIINNLNGIYSEKVRRFRNKTAIPAADSGQLVKALENELASFDGEIMQRDMLGGTGGASGEYVIVASDITEINIKESVVKLPVWTTDTDSSTPQRISGYNVYGTFTEFSRRVSVSVKRTYYTTCPTIASVTSTSRTAASGRYVYGVGTGGGTFVLGGNISYIMNVIELGQGLYAVEEKTITTDDWAIASPVYVPIVYTPA